MKKYVLKFIIFLSPLALLFALPLLVFTYGREFTPISDVINAQKNNQPLLFGLAYNNVKERYQTLSTLARDPEIIVLGTSRVMEFRSTFFKPRVNFYNAGGAINFAQDYPKFIKEISDDQNLKVILMGIDPHLLNPNRDEYWKTWKEGNISPWARLHDFFIARWKSIYLDYFMGKFSFYNLIQQHKLYSDIGVGALINKTGFRNDGSYRYLADNELESPEHQKKLQEQIGNVIDSITFDPNSFEYNTTVSTEGLQAIEEFLKLCHEKNIYVIGFLTPYANAIYKEILSLNNQYTATMNEIPNRLKPLFKKYNYSFYDLTDITLVGSSDQELVDEVHPSEKTSLKIMKYISERDKILSSYSIGF